MNDPVLVMLFLFGGLLFVVLAVLAVIIATVLVRGKQLENDDDWRHS